MAGIKITLLGGYSGRTERVKNTLRGLGLKHIGQTRILRDSAALRGMIAKVQHILDIEAVEETPPIRKRRSSKTAE